MTNIKTLNKVLIPFNVYNVWAELLNSFLPSCPEKKKKKKHCIEKNIRVFSF